MTIAIVGGGLAAATTATELRKRGHDGPIVVYAAEDHLPYERPPLSKGVLLGKAELETVFVHDADWYRDNDIDLRTGVRVTAIEPDKHLLRTDDLEDSYAQLVLATGSSPRHLAMADNSGKPVVDPANHRRQSTAANRAQ